MTQIKEDDALLLELVLHETSLVDDSSVLAFTWTMQSFEEYKMKIKVTFDKPEYISSGLDRDLWIVTIKNSKYFLSQDT